MTFHEWYTRHYVARHAAPTCHYLHLAGPPVSTIAAGVVAWVGNWWLLPLVVVPPFLLAWLGHALARNRPTFFEHPIWSIQGYWKMVIESVMGRFGQQARRAKTETP